MEHLQEACTVYWRYRSSVYVYTISNPLRQTTVLNIQTAGGNAPVKNRLNNSRNTVEERDDPRELEIRREAENRLLATHLFLKCQCASIYVGLW